MSPFKGGQDVQQNQCEETSHSTAGGSKQDASGRSFGIASSGGTEASAASPTKVESKSHISSMIDAKIDKADVRDGDVDEAVEQQAPSPESDSFHLSRNEAPHASSAEAERFWDVAYDHLKEEYPNMVSWYEVIVSLNMQQEDSSPTLYDPTWLSPRLRPFQNKISQDDALARRKQMQHLMDTWFNEPNEGLSEEVHSSELYRSTLSLRDALQKISHRMPYAVLVWAGACFASRILLSVPNPAAETKSDHLDFINLISKLEWFCNLYKVLSPPASDSGQEFDESHHEPRRKLIDLYAAILMYEMKIICFYFGRKHSAFADAKYAGGSSFPDRGEAKRLVDEAENTFSLSNGFQVRLQLEQLFEVMQSEKMVPVDDEDPSQRDEESQLVRDLHVTEPGQGILSPESEGIVSMHELNEWMLSMQEYKDFLDWHKHDKNILWVSAGPGRGKMMLFTAIARQLSAKRKEQPTTSNLAYFFCDSSTFGTNSAVAVLKGLIRMVLVQQPSLEQYLAMRKSTGRTYFDDPSDFPALCGVFCDMLKSNDFAETYFLVDSIDECSTEDDGHGLGKLLHLIEVSTSLSSKIKWLVSSSQIETPKMKDKCYLISLDSGPTCRPLFEAMDGLISHKVSELAEEKGYGATIKKDIMENIRERSILNLLWVTIVCMVLREEDNWYAVDVLKEMPGDLHELYNASISSIQKLPRKDPTFCMEVLSTMAVAHQPLHISELPALVALPGGVDILAIVKKCSTFLEVRNNLVCFRHPSAKIHVLQYVRQSTILQAPINMLERAIRSLTTFLNEKMVTQMNATTEQIDRETYFAPVRYSSIYWMRHICEIQDIEKHPQSINAVISFLKNQFVHWLELLALMERVAMAATGLLRLETFLIAQPNCPNELIRVVRDAHQIICFHNSAVNRPGAVRAQNTLLFSPSSSITREKILPKWVTTRPLIGHREFQTLTGHVDWVRCIAFSRDGVFLASGSDDATVRIWDAQAGTMQHTLRGHSGWIYSLAFSCSGLLASGGDDSTVRLWEPITGRTHKILSGHSGQVNAITFAPDGKKLVVATMQNFFIWDIAADEPKPVEFEAHSDYIRSIVFSADGKFLISGGDDREVRVWNWDGDTCELFRTLTGHGESINCIVSSPFEYHIASGSDDGYILVWDAESGEEIKRSSQLDTSILSLAFSHDGSKLVSGCLNSVIYVWDYKKGPTQELRGHTRAVASVAFSPEGLYLASSSHDTKIRFWYDKCDETTSIGEAEHPRGQPPFSTHPIYTLAVSPDGRYIASVAGDYTITLWDGDTGERLERASRMGHSDDVSSLVFSHDGQCLASASDDKLVHIYYVADGRLRHSFSDHGDWVRCVAFSADAQYVVSGSDDFTVRVWCLESGLSEVIRGHEDYVRAVAFSPCGQYLASCSDTVRIWERASGSPTWTQKFKMDPEPTLIRAVLFYPNPDQALQILLSDGFTMWILDVQTGGMQPLQAKPYKGHVQTMWFDGRSTDYVMTMHGALPLGPEVRASGPSSDKPETQQAQPLPPARHPYGILYDDEDDSWWITWKTQKVIFIPAEYAPNCSYVNGHKVVLGCASGHTLLFKFSTDITPPIGDFGSS
ncbi:Vegetative incompatibility protein HET-E-1 [Cytospora mali]|uniref:Mitochondrial division protein 1 n=1 Tax=Cytospora mali TaxID=578113 RepID=A0A194W0J3_CYTMA|nr:Vegetative incompatibility protein HET-E-1 [Valsa mali]